MDGAYSTILADAIQIFTEAARLRRIVGAGTEGEHTESVDFAEFVSAALASAAANVGGIDTLLAGRPGSWEADYVRNLLYATVGCDEDYLSEYRTEP